MIIGIDLGTTNSCVSFVEGGQAVIIPNAEGNRTTPSMVAFNDQGERLVGQIAKRQAIMNPTNTVFATKRLLGRKIDSPEVQGYIDRLPYPIIPADNGDAWIKLKDKAFSPAQVSSFILATMKELAEEYLGQPVTEAVITVPAYFNDLQRQATKDAGLIAGLDVKRIINEPTAAALAYGLDRTENERIVVYDLGGGTFDVSVLELTDGVFEVCATSGDTYLGGEDFDFCLMEHLLNLFYEETQIDLSEDKVALQRIKEAAEKAKHELSSVLETEINLPFIASDQDGAKHLVIKITRSEFETMVHELIERTITPCITALEDAECTIDDIHAVLLVGGMTRMPKIQERVAEFFKRRPNKGLNPDEVVAAGAAIQGGVLEGEVDHVVLLDVTPLSLGVETQGGVMTKIIEKNTMIPCSDSQVFTTVIDNQPFVTVHVLQGERPLANDNRSLARFNLPGIPPAPRGFPQIDVNFEIDANGILNVSAVDLNTNKRQQVEVRASGGLSDQDIQNMILEADQYRQHDMERQLVIELRNKAKSLLHATETTVQEYSGLLSVEETEELNIDIQLLKGSLESIDVEELSLAIQNLEQAAYRTSELIYSRSSEVDKDQLNPTLMNQVEQETVNPDAVEKFNHLNNKENDSPSSDSQEFTTAILQALEAPPNIDQESPE